MHKSWKIIITIVLVLLLLQGVIFAVKQANEPPYEIRFGVPVYDAASDTLAKDFSGSKPLKMKHDINSVLFSLIQAPSATGFSGDKKDAYAFIQIYDPDENTAWFFTIWVQEDAIIVDTESDYKILTDNSYGYDSLLELLNRHIPANS